MSGRVPLSSRARSTARRATRSMVEAAGQLYERFTGHGIESLGVFTTADVPPVVAAFGELDAVEYTTTRDGKIEKYRHVFHRDDKPLLCVTPDGRQLLLIGGRYAFTEAGIVDQSDRKNWARYVTDK